MVRRIIYKAYNASFTVSLATISIYELQLYTTIVLSVSLCQLMHSISN
jgi:hypothetical protein